MVENKLNLASITLCHSWAFGPLNASFIVLDSISWMKHNSLMKSKESTIR